MNQSASQAKGTDNRAIRPAGPLHDAEVQSGHGKQRVVVSAVISTYLLTHLHHVLQRAEFGAVQDGRQSQAANYAQLRKVLCLDARSMEDASALGMRDDTFDQAA